MSIVSSGCQWWHVAPEPRRRAAGALRLEEREEISRGVAAGRSMRRIAQGLGRSPSTVSREIGRNGGCSGYRASEADTHAWERALRPKPCRLARHAGLRWRVAQKLALEWSPEQIAGWLKQQFPANHGMQISHETIYRSLFIQTRGVLKKELMVHLRTARQMRQSQGRQYKRVDAWDRSSIPSPSANGRPRLRDRAVPGRCEGDLLTGTNNSHIATLVGERHTRFCDASQDPEQGHRNRGRRAHETRAQTAAAAAPLLDLGPRQGDGRPQEFHRRYQRAGLFLRSTQPLAARQQREHQRFAATVFPARNRSLMLLARLPKQRSRGGSITAPARPWGSKPLPIDYKRCCTDRLSPPG